MYLSDRRYLQLQTKYGITIIRMFPEIAPIHVNRIKFLVSEKFYDGLAFWKGGATIMVQTGCPNNDGTGNTGYTMQTEYSKMPTDKGMVMAARNDPKDVNSEDSQFWILLENIPRLVGQYTVWGEVVEGMNCIDKIKTGGLLGEPLKNPDKIISLSLIDY